MIITCEECNSSFKINDELIKPTGSKVRCSMCEHVFVAYRHVEKKSESRIEEPVDTAVSADSIEDIEKEIGDVGDLDFDFEDVEEGVTDVDLEGLDLDFDLESEEAAIENEIEPALEKIQQELDAMEEIESEITDEKGEDDFDFSDIENMIESLEADEELEASLKDIDDLELDLALSEDTDSIERGVLDVADLEMEVEDLPGDEADISTGADFSEIPDDIGKEISTEGEEDFLDLDDLELEDEPAELPAKTEDLIEDGIDFSEIESMLDLEDEVEKEEEPADEFDLELDLELEPVAQEASTEPLIEEEAQDEFDFSELEELLDDKDVDSGEDLEESMDLELELESELERIEEEPEEEIADIEIDLADDEIELEIDTDDLLGDIEKADEAEPELSTGDDLLAEDIDFGEIEGQIDLDDEDALKEKSDTIKLDDIETPKDKKATSRILIVLFIITLIAGGTYGVYSYMVKSGMKVPEINEIKRAVKELGIPFISDSMDVVDPDPHGNLKINAYNVTNKFISNPDAGVLFIIRGNVKNEYDMPRKEITLIGKLYSEADGESKRLVKQNVVYAGNSITDDELKRLDMKTIQQRLGNRFGEGGINTNIMPGESVKFLVVFSNLPDKLEEFSVEVAGSKVE